MYTFEHKEHRTDNLIKLYEMRLCEKIKRDIKSQIIAQKMTGNLSEETATKLIDNISVDFEEDKNGHLNDLDLDLNDAERKIIDTINEATFNTVKAYFDVRLEMMCQLDACDAYEKELTVLYSYNILNDRGFVEDFKEIVKDEE